MSAIAMTQAERIQAVMRFGYTEREATFICLVALNGGFFLRRQYCKFADAGDGRVPTALIDKLLRNEHGKMVTGFGNLRVHHVFARPIYNAIGQENNRNRRERAAVAMKNRLMGLDFVLEQPANTFLMTEQEKIAYFTTILGIASADLPRKEFRSPSAEVSTGRYFIDKYPIFLPANAEEAFVSFTFIDEGVITTSRFETYLHQYEQLFARLTRFAVIYVAASDKPFVAAEKTFEAFLSGGGRRDPVDVGATDLKRLADYFARQYLWDTGQLDSFGREEMIQLRNDRSEFSIPFYQALYDRWKVLGDEVFRQTVGYQRPLFDPSRACFSTSLLPHNYDVFGN